MAFSSTIWACRASKTARPVLVDASITACACWASSCWSCALIRFSFAMASKTSKLPAMSLITVLTSKSALLLSSDCWTRSRTADKRDSEVAPLANRLAAVRFMDWITPLYILALPSVILDTIVFSASMNSSVFALSAAVGFKKETFPEPLGEGNCFMFFVRSSAKSTAKSLLSTVSCGSLLDFCVSLPGFCGSGLESSTISCGSLPICDPQFPVDDFLTFRGFLWFHFLDFTTKIVCPCGVRVVWIYPSFVSLTRIA